MAAEVKVFVDLNDVERDAGPALTRAARPCMFERLDWYRLVDRFTPPEGDLLALRARNGKAQAWLFLAKKGAQALAFSNWYCMRFGPIVDGGNADAALDELVRGLRGAGVSNLFLSPVAADDPLPAALRRRGWLTRLSKTSVNWRIRTAGMSFEEYWAKRPSKLRNTARRRAKSGGFELRVLDRFDGEAWADYEAVYEASWKPAEGSPALMRQLAETEGAAGTLRLGLAYLDGRAVAGQIWTVENGVAIIHKLAYREDAKQHSPGTVLSVEMFRRVLDVDKVDAIDFGFGDQSYKADWMEEALPLYALVAYDLLSARGLAGLVKSAASKLVRRPRND